MPRAQEQLNDAPQSSGRQSPRGGLPASSKASPQEPPRNCSGLTGSSDLKKLQESVDAMRSELSMMGRSIRIEVQKEMDEFTRAFKAQLLDDEFSKEFASTIATVHAQQDAGGSYFWPYLGSLGSLVGNPFGEDAQNPRSPLYQDQEDRDQEEQDVEFAGELAEPLLPSPTGNIGIEALDSKTSMSGTSSDKFRQTVKRRYGILKAGQQEQEQEEKKAAVRDIEDLYNETGMWQRLARTNSTFHWITLIVIVLNVIWIGIDTDINRADVLSEAPVVSQIANNIFCFYFCFEMLVRFMAFKRKCNAFRDSAFNFDLSLVALMVWETWIEVALYACMDEPPGKTWNVGSIFRSYRLLRLTRLARVARISNLFPELMILIKGMVAAMRSVAAILCLLGLFIFLFGIMFRQLLADIDLPEGLKGSFDSVPGSMNTLLNQVLAGVDIQLMDDLQKLSWFYYVVFMLFVFLGTLTLMNMLIGVLCEVMSKVSGEEGENNSLKDLEHQIGIIIDTIDEDKSGTISEDEFEELMHSDAGLQSLDKLGVDIPAFSEFCNFVFHKCKELTLGDFCNLVVQFRGAKTATVKDIVDLRKYISMQIDVNLRKQTAKLLANNFKR